MRRSATSSARSDPGFTLIEMMAALAVIALGGLALMNMVQATTRNAAAVQARSLASLAAENLMNTELIRAGTPGFRSGEYDLAGERFDWRLQVDPTSDPRLMRLYLTVSADGETGALAEIETFRRRGS